MIPQMISAMNEVEKAGHLPSAEVAIEQAENEGLDATKEVIIPSEQDKLALMKVIRDGQQRLGRVVQKERSREYLEAKPLPIEEDTIPPNYFKNLKLLAAGRIDDIKA